MKVDPGPLKSDVEMLKMGPQNPYDQRFDVGLKSSKMALESQSRRNCQNPYKGWSVPLVAAIAFSHCSRSTKATYRAGGGVLGTKMAKMSSYDQRSDVEARSLKVDAEDQNQDHDLETRC